MGGCLNDILVIADMDGTLLDPHCELPACNLETIRLFTALGGKFTVATGRTYESVKMYPGLADTLTAGIICNGAVLYDFQRDKVAQSAILPRLVAHQVLQDILAKFPTVGAMVMGSDQRNYQVRPSPKLQNLVHEEELSFFHKPMEDLPPQWNKVLFSSEREVLADIAEYVAGRSYPGVYFVSTHEAYFEIMPHGVSKASALQPLCDILDAKIENTYFIGDYYNDLDIMRLAGYSVAMGNAPDEVKEIANEVIGTNEEGAVGQFLYGLIDKYCM